jgi:hypothetical protein
MTYCSRRGSPKKAALTKKKTAVPAHAVNGLCNFICLTLPPSLERFKGDHIFGRSDLIVN